MNVAEAEFPQKQQELFEGVVALVAVGVLTSMVFWMKKAARSIKAELHDSVDAALARRVGRRLALVADGVLRGRPRGAGIRVLPARDLPAGRRLGRAARRPARRSLSAVGVRRGRLPRRHTGSTCAASSPGPASSSSSWRRACSPGRCAPSTRRGSGTACRSRPSTSSSVLPADGMLGTLLSGIFGYQDTPTVGRGRRSTSPSWSRRCGCFFAPSRADRAAPRARLTSSPSVSQDPDRMPSAARLTVSLAALCAACAVCGARRGRRCAARSR